MFNFFKVQKVNEKKKEPIVVNDFNNIDAILEYVKTNIGIDFDNQKSILKNRMIRVCKKHNLTSFRQCLEQLKNDTTFRQLVINNLTTNESYFNREVKQIQELVSKIQANKSSVSILCAPCATGEEPYSIVISLLEGNVPLEKFSLIGIDISSFAIEKSILGIYDKNSVRNLSQNVLSKYFTKVDSLYKINENIQKQIAFKCINIFDKEFKELGKFDYIFSRNMLIYFDNATKKKAKDVFLRQLKNQDEDIFFGHADLPPS